MFYLFVCLFIFYPLLNFVISFEYQHLWDLVSQNRLIDLILCLWKIVICGVNQSIIHGHIDVFRFME